MIQTELHSLLLRQIRKHFGSVEKVPPSIQGFLDAVSDAYLQHDADRKMIERSLELSSEELLKVNADIRALFRFLPDVCVRTDSAGTIIDNISGRDSEVCLATGCLVGRHVGEVPGLDAGNEIRRVFRSAVSAGRSETVEYALEVKGARRFFEDQVIPVESGQCVVFRRDVTRRKEAETERSRLVTAVEQAAESVVITDTTGAILYTNPAFERITGYRRDEVLGKNPRMMKSGRQSGEFYRQMWDTLLGGKPWQGHFTNRRKDGTFVEMEATISPIRGSDGKVANFVLVGHDVTREVDLEERLRQSQKMEAVGRLAGGIAHDFNNLLTAIIGNADLALGSLSETDPIRDEILEMKRSAMRAASLTSQLLAFGRKQVLNPKTLNLNAVVLELGRLLRRVIGENIEMNLSLSHELWPIRADPVQIESVLMNLALNARDAMPNGGQLAIRTENRTLARQEGDIPAGAYVVVGIIDTGIGMDANTKAHLFEPFFTTKERGKGTGLGLATAYGIIKQSEGFITVDSSPGAGATFTIYFPRAKEKPAVAPAPVPLPTTTQGSETILLLEDEKQVRKLAATILQKFGYKVIEARNGAEAIDLASQYGSVIHLLLTDVVMPGMTGESVARKLVDMRPDLKVLFMSGHPETMLTHMGVILSDGRFINKPFTSIDLARKVREVLDK